METTIGRQASVTDKSIHCVNAACLLVAFFIITEDAEKQLVSCLWCVSRGIRS